MGGGGRGGEGQLEQAALCRVASLVCAVPLALVGETMRPLPVQPLAGGPPFVLGFSRIRSAACVVVDVARLLGVPAAPPARFLTARAGERWIALAVDEVLGVKALAREDMLRLPSLFERGGEPIAAVGTIDADLVFLLESSRIVPAALWDRLDQEATA